MDENAKTYIKNWYAQLCVRARHYQIHEDEAICTHCNRTKREHYRGRCSSLATSVSFRSRDAEIAAWTNQAIVAVEALAESVGWSLTDD